MSENHHNHTYTQQDTTNLQEFVRSYFARDVEKMEIKLIEFATRHNLLPYLDDHKQIVAKQADVIIPFGKEHDFSLGDIHYNTLINTQKEILKDFPNIDADNIPQYIKDWVIMLNHYNSCFFIPRLECTSKEEKASTLKEIKKGLLEANPLFLIDKRTYLKLSNGIPFRVSLDINPITIHKFFIEIFRNVKTINRKQAKAKLEKVLSEKSADDFLDEENEAAKYALRCITLFVQTFSYQMDQKLREICQDTLTLFNLDAHRRENPELQQEVKEECFNIISKSRLEDVSNLLGYKNDNNAPKSPGRPKTFSPVIFLKDIMTAAKKIGQNNQEPSLKKIAKELGLQEQQLKSRLDEIGMDKELFYNLINQAAQSKGVGNTGK